MADMPWREAIVKALQDTGTPMHYAEIARAIIDSEYRVNVGATPANTVAANLSASVRSRRRSPFVKVDRGVYALRDAMRESLEVVDATDQAEEDSREMGLINAFGMFWDREQVRWQANTPPRLLGVQQQGSTPVNFTTQAGVYILYDSSRPIYVGRVTEPRMGLRLRHHIRDRLTGRWNRFSWFGVRGVRDNGELTPMPTVGIGVASLIATMEAPLIEGLERPQNRRQGDGFNAVEFLQEPDPAD